MVDAVSIGSVAWGMIYNVLMAIVIVIVAVAIWFGTRQYKKHSSKQKQFKINAVIISRNGTVATDKLAFLKTADNMLNMEFQKRKQDHIPPIPYEYLRNNQCILFNYAPGQYAPIDPLTWECVNLNKFNIKLLNNNMKNFAMLEQRAATGRWAVKQEKMKAMMPWITLAIVAIASSAIAWFMMKTALTMYNQGVAARLVDCSTVLPTYSPPVPT